MRRGFTLVELMVCIAIIGIVVSIIVPALRKTRGSGGVHSAPSSSVVSTTTSTTVPKAADDDAIVVKGHTYVHSSDCAHPSHR